MGERQWGTLIAVVLAVAGLVLWLIFHTRLGFPLLAAAAAVAIGTFVRRGKD